MKSSFLIFVLAILIGSVKTLPTQAQYTGFNWTFGDSCGVHFNTAGIDSFYTSSVKSRGTCASISDSVGNLLFYAASPHVALWQAGVINQGAVYNKNHQIMQNGDSLYTTGWFNEMTIISYPNHPNMFILFLAGITSNANPGLRYCVVDLNQNNGLGAITQKNILLDPTSICDGMIAIRHGNGRDWWLIYRTWDTTNNKFYKILIDDQGVHTATQQSIGTLNITGFYRLKSSPSGNKIAGVSTAGQIEIFDFDRCTGSLSNYQSIANIPVAQIDSTSSFWDLEFSSSGRFLYVCTSSYSVYLYQLDLISTNIYNSKITIDYLASPPFAGSYLKRGPDNRIYRAISWYDGFNYNFPYPDTTYNIYNTHLSVINEPDSLGVTCDYQAFSVYLPTCRTYTGLPNNPDYTLGPLVGSACDTLSVGVQESQEEIKPFSLYPNPFAGNLTLERRAGWNQPCDITVYDLAGKIISQLHWSYEKKIEISSNNWQNGLYLIQINMNGKRFNLKGVKM